MPSASREVRRKRRLKRTNSLLRRELQKETLARLNGRMTLLAVLAQKGSEVTITKGTIDQVVEQLNNLTYEIVAGETDGEYVIKLVTLTESASTPAATEFVNAQHGEPDSIVGPSESRPEGADLGV